MAKQADNQDRDRNVREFKRRQNRQFIAIATALFLVALSAVVYKRPDQFGEFSQNSLFGAQALVIAAFIGFTYINWRCPSCTRYMGSDITRRICRKCGTRLV